MNIIQKVRAVLAVRKAVTKIGEVRMKNGITSTEFWLNLVTIAGTLYGALQGFIPQAMAAKVIAVLVIGYTLARSLVKAAEIVVKLTGTTKDDAFVAGASAVLDKIKEVFGAKTGTPAA